MEALKIKDNENKYINEVFSFDETPYDLLSIACYYGDNDKKKALFYMKKALDINPNNERIINNIKILEEETE